MFSPDPTLNISPNLFDLNILKYASHKSETCV